MEDSQDLFCQRQKLKGCHMTAESMVNQRHIAAKVMNENHVATEVREKGEETLQPVGGIQALALPLFSAAPQSQGQTPLS